MTTAFIIRMHYPINHPKWQWRLDYFKSEVLPRLIAQTDRRFDICVWVNGWHQDDLKSLARYVKVFGVAPEQVRRKGKYFVDFAPWANVQGLHRYDLQLGLDSDDIIAADYVAMAKAAVLGWRKGNPGKSLHLSFQPGLYDYKTELVRPMRTQYHTRKGSAFFGIYQPIGVRKYIFAYQYSHLQLWRYTNATILLPEGYCWASVHGYNESTGIKQ